MDTSTASKIINENRYKCKHFKVIYDSGLTIKTRLFVSQNGYVCYYAPKKKRSGYPLSNLQQVAQIIPLIPTPEDKVKTFTHNLNTVIKYLTQSHLWPDILSKLQPLAATEITADNFPEIYDSLKYELQTLANKRCIVSIPYPRYEREQLRQQAAEAIEKAKAAADMEIETSTMKYFWRSNYDHRIEIRSSSGAPLAWYSAEYKNCGNGHYYLMIDASHALFIEDD